MRVYRKFIGDDIMKKLWLAAVAALALSTSAAIAADLGQPYVKAPPPPPPPPSWAGFYIGFNGGWGEAQRSGDLFCAGGVACTALNGNILKPNGGLFGGQIGYNWETNNFVVWGIETDGQWADIHDSASAAVGLLGRDTLTASEKLDWFGTTRIRLGITPWGNTALLYVTGGVIYGGGTASASLNVPGLGFFSRSVSATRAGGTAGVGLEYMFTPTVSAKIEGLWFDMGSRDLFLPTIDETAHTHLTGAIVRAGLNWHVNWFGGGGYQGQY
jgi:outer membrane immunogenic protein